MKKKRLFYVPGLISLIGLPALLFLFPVKDPVFYNSLKMNLPQDEIQKPESDGMPRFDKAYLKQTLRGKKVEQVYLGEYHEYNGDIERYSQNRKLHFIANEMERLQFTHDTSTVLQVSFGNENTYGQLIYILNLTILDQFKRYALYGNDLYLFPNPPPKPTYEIRVDEFPLPDIGAVGTVPSITKWDIFLWNTENRFRQFRYEVRDNLIFCSSFLILIGLPFTIHLFVKKRKKQLAYAKAVE